MSNVPVARRYARALLDAAGSEADQVLEQLEAITAYFEGQPELFATMGSPMLTGEERVRLVGALIANCPGIKPALANLFRLLADRNRFGLTPFIARQYRDFVDTRLGRIRGRVTSAAKLGDSQVRALKQQLEALTERSVVLETAVDPSLLGGAVANVGSFQYDGSLKSQLEELGRFLKAPRVQNQSQP
jgi:F-type H+-transporting ATPase subunit delta